MKYSLDLINLHSLQILAYFNNFYITVEMVVVTPTNLINLVNSSRTAPSAPRRIRGNLRNSYLRLNYELL